MKKLTIAVADCVETLAADSQLGSEFTLLVRKLSYTGFNFQFNLHPYENNAATIVANNVPSNRQIDFAIAHNPNAPSLPSTCHMSLLDPVSNELCRSACSQYHPYWDETKPHQQARYMATYLAIADPLDDDDRVHAVIQHSHDALLSQRQYQHPRVSRAPQSSPSFFPSDFVINLTEDLGIPRINLSGNDTIPEIEKQLSEIKEQYLAASHQHLDFSIPFQVLSDAQQRILDPYHYCAAGPAADRYGEHQNATSPTACSWSGAGSFALSISPYLIDSSFPYDLRCDPQRFIFPELRDHAMAAYEASQLRTGKPGVFHKEAIALFDSAIEKVREAQQELLRNPSLDFAEVNEPIEKSPPADSFTEQSSKRMPNTNPIADNTTRGNEHEPTL